MKDKILKEVLVWYDKHENKNNIFIEDFVDKVIDKTADALFNEVRDGFIDEFKIYNRVISGEQIYQNYLCTKDGITTRSVIVSDETHVGERWKCTVTPNDGIQDDEEVESNILDIVPYGGGWKKWEKKY